MDEQFGRYRRLIEGVVGMPAAFVAEAEGAGRVQVERGLGLAAALGGAEAGVVEAYFEPVVSGEVGVPPGEVVDRMGHRRGVYRGLLGYCFAQGLGVVGARLGEAARRRWIGVGRRWGEVIAEEVKAIDWPTGAWPAARGGALADGVWGALTLAIGGNVLGRDEWVERAGEVFGKLARGQAAGGAWLAAGLGDNPETWWYHELVLLHAAASYAVQFGDRTVAEAVSRAARFQAAEVQSDHATTQPWGVFAFLWDEETRGVGEGMIHAAGTGGGGVGKVLLADALLCLRLLD